MQSGKPEHFKDNCNWCIPAVDNWGINAMAVVSLVVLPCLGNNSPGWLKYRPAPTGYLSSHPPPWGIAGKGVGSFDKV